MLSDQSRRRGHARPGCDRTVIGEAWNPEDIEVDGRTPAIVLARLVADGVCLETLGSGSVSLAGRASKRAPSIRLRARFSASYGEIPPKRSRGGGQPLGHRSVFRINNVRAVWRHSIAPAVE